MKTSPRLLLSVATLLVGTAGFAKTDSLTVSVRGQVGAGYQRARLADGSFKPERYVIADGGKFEGTTKDSSMEKVSYPEVAGIVARHLAAQKYFLAQKAQDADLLIAIYWGQTIPFNSSNYNQAVDSMGRSLNQQLSETSARTLGEGGVGTQPRTQAQVQSYALPDSTGTIEFMMGNVELENRYRDKINEGNAKVLGYMDAINERREMLAWADVGSVQQDLVSDVEEGRYYVVVMAYDFKRLQRDGKRDVKWATRISIGAQGTGFDERVAQMVAAAANTFGQEQGLKRRFYGDPRVDLGELKFLGETSVPNPADKK